ncbi:CRP-like cAMP-binding protein [Sphingomonas sp. PvP056]|jgi:CRP-like cAMP-binding protein
MPIPSIHDVIIASLSRHSVLDPDDHVAIRRLIFTQRQVEPSAYLVREGEKPVRCSFILGGFTYAQRLTSTGARQIVSLQIPGDFVDLQNPWFEEADHNVQALTRAQVVDIDAGALRTLVADRPAVAAALWRMSLIGSSILREWIVNIGRRDAHTRVGHLLCEFSLRREVAGIPSTRADHLPMTQEQLGDTVGLTPVHVNRVLKALAQRGLIERDRRQIRIVDWAGLRDASDFNPRYLHLTPR